MTWRRIEQAPSRGGTGRYRIPSTSGYRGHSEATKTTALDVWRCDGCGFLACGNADENPGACLNAKCRFGKKG